MLWGIRGLDIAGEPGVIITVVQFYTKLISKHQNRWRIRGVELLKTSASKSTFSFRSYYKILLASFKCVKCLEILKPTTQNLYNL